MEYFSSSCGFLCNEIHQPHPLRESPSSCVHKSIIIIVWWKSTIIVLPYLACTCTYIIFIILVCMNIHSLCRVATPVIPVDWERECQVSSDNGNSSTNINGNSSSSSINGGTFV